MSSSKHEGEDERPARNESWDCMLINVFLNYSFPSISSLHWPLWADIYSSFCISFPLLLSFHFFHFNTPLHEGIYFPLTLMYGIYFRSWELCHIITKSCIKNGNNLTFNYFVAILNLHPVTFALSNEINPLKTLTVVQILNKRHISYLLPRNIPVIDWIWSENPWNDAKRWVFFSS